MAGTFIEIRDEILAAKAAEADLAGLTSTSDTAVWRLWIDIQARAIWALEVLFDLHKTEVNTIIAELRPHTRQWYRLKALYFMYGYPLITDSDLYDQTGLTEAQIEAAQIVEQASVTENEGQLIIKVAKDDGSGGLEKLSAAEEAALNAYFDVIKDAGVRITIITDDPDDLALTIDIYYDPLVLDSNGARLDGTEADVVENAINAYLRGLPFDGQFITVDMVDGLQATEGINIPEVKYIASRYGVLPYTQIDARVIPNAGYMILGAGVVTINYIADV